MTKSLFAITWMTIISFVSCKQNQTSTELKTAGHIEIYDPEMLQIVDSNAVIEILADGFNWSEGPLWLPSENKLIFTDVPENTIYAWDEKNGKQLYLNPSQRRQRRCKWTSPR